MSGEQFRLNFSQWHEKLISFGARGLAENGYILIYQQSLKKPYNKKVIELL